jgi:GTPase SAR1 family protein
MNTQDGQGSLTVEWLAECERRVAASPDAPQELLTAVQRAGERYNLPMRVALVGQIKRGKSTLVNALLGQDVAPTAHLEATFTVGEFHHAPRPQVVVHFTDLDARPLPVEPEEFRRYTINDPTRIEVLRRIRRVEYGMPNRLLNRFRLLDTPGLGSLHHLDSENTLTALGISGFLDAEEEGKLERTLAAVGRSAGDLHADTVEAIDGADAIIYLFDRALSERDASVIVRFLGPLGPSFNALKAVGVLSRCDQWYWPPVDLPDGNPLDYDPLAVARRVTTRYGRQADVQRMFFRIMPVAALAAAGTIALDGRRLNWLDALGTMEPTKMFSALCDTNRFAQDDRIEGVPLPREARARLMTELGAWGTLKAATYRREGVASEELRSLMLEDSGVGEVRRTVLGHFGNRADVLKLAQALRDISQAVVRLRMQAVRTGTALPNAVGTVAGILERVRLGSGGLSELAVLEDYYRDRLELDPNDLDEVLRVSGEYGRSVTARIGAAEGTPLAELSARADARASAWMNRADVLGLDGATAVAAREIGLSYARLSARIREARRMLLWDDENEEF